MANKTRAIIVCDKYSYSLLCQRKTRKIFGWHDVTNRPTYCSADHL